MWRSEEAAGVGEKLIPVENKSISKNDRWARIRNKRYFVIMQRCINTNEIKWRKQNILWWDNVCSY